MGPFRNVSSFVESAYATGGSNCPKADHLYIFGTEALRVDKTNLDARMVLCLAYIFWQVEQLCMYLANIVTYVRPVRFIRFVRSMLYHQYQRFFNPSVDI